MKPGSGILATEPYNSPQWQLAFNKINNILDQTVQRSARTSGRTTERNRENSASQIEPRDFPQDVSVRIGGEPEKTKENIYTTNFSALDPSHRTTFAEGQQHPSLTQFNISDQDNSPKDRSFRGNILPLNNQPAINLKSTDITLQTDYRRVSPKGDYSDYSIRVNDKSYLSPQILNSDSPSNHQMLSAEKQRPSEKALNAFNMDRSILDAQYEYARLKASSPVRLTQTDTVQTQLNQSNDAIAVKKALFFGEVTPSQKKSQGDTSMMIQERRGSQELNDQSRMSVRHGFDYHHLHKDTEPVNLVEENIREIERSFLLKLKAEEEENDNEEAIHCMYIERQDIANFSQRKRAQSPQSTNDLDSRSQSGHHRSPIRGPKTYEHVREEYPDGTRYEGDKYLGKRHGKGVYYYREGYKYEGNWEDDLMSGYGVLWYNKDRKMYEGEWQRGKFNGRGVLFNHVPQMVSSDFDGRNFEDLRSSWIMFEGSFKNGKKNGLGTVVIANGDKFVGNFVDDVVEGEGSYTIINGRTILGVWKQNRLFEEF